MSHSDWQDEDIIVYVSNACPTCEKVVRQLEKCNIRFKIKNVTENRADLHEMQQKGIYGTPATIHQKLNQHVLGFNKKVLRKIIKIHTTINSEKFLTFES